jgi:WD40 repeat protein
MVKVWSISTGEEIWSVRAGSPMKTVAFSPDGKLLAGAGSGNAVRILDAATGRQLRVLKGHTQFVQAVVFSPDGKRLASGSLDQTVKLWEVDTGRELRSLKGHRVQALAFCPADPARLASGSIDGGIQVWDLAKGQVAFTLSEPYKLDVKPDELLESTWAVLCVAFSPDGARLASGHNKADSGFYGGAPDLLKVWDLQARRLASTFRGHDQDVHSVAFSPDGRSLASGSSDRTVRLWDVATGREIRVYRGHKAGVSSVVFSPDGTRLVSGGGEYAFSGEVKIWDTTAEPGVVIRRGKHPLGKAAFSPDGRSVASCFGGDVTVEDLETGREIFSLKGRATDLAFSPDGTRLATVAVGGSVQVLDARTGRSILTLTPQNRRAAPAAALLNAVSLAFSPNGRLLAAADDRIVRIWDVETGRQSLTLEGHTSPIESLAFSRDGGHLASAAAWPAEIRCWEVRPAGASFTLPLKFRASCLTFSHDGKQLVAGREDGSVTVWELESRRVVRSLSVHSGAAENVGMIQSIALSPDGSRLASAGGDLSVKLWDLDTGQEVLTLQERMLVTRVAFSRDGKRLLSLGLDNPVKIRDTDMNGPSTKPGNPPESRRPD